VKNHRPRFALCLLLTVLLGVGSFLLQGTSLDGIANFAGGGLYVIALIFFILALAPKYSQLQHRLPLCAFAFLFTCAIEFLQLWHLPILESIRSTLPGRLVLGNTFSWMDFPAYFVGALVASWTLNLGGGGLRSRRDSE
jgi:hypothetical protein